MKILYIKVVAIALMLSLALSALGCNGGEGQEMTTPSDVPAAADPEDTAAPAAEFYLHENFKIVRPDEGTDVEIEALRLLLRGIESATGLALKAGTDFTRPDADVVAGEYEILIGATNRPQSVETAAQMSYYDWEFKVVSENVIVICGGSPEATLAATVAFLAQSFGYTENEEGEVTSAGTNSALTVGQYNDLKYRYQVDKLTVGERDISEYTIVAKSATANGVDTLSDAFNRLTGERLAIAELDSFKGGPAIYFGYANADGGHLDVQPFGNSRYYIKQVGEDIVIDFRSSSVGESAAEAFANAYLQAATSEHVSIDIGDTVLTGVHISKGTNSLRLEEVKQTEIADGMIYEERLYRDPDNKPVRAYILTVAAGAASFYTSTPADAAVTGKVSNIPSQMKSAAENGKTVIAGINADFFDMGGTNVMRGLCIKDGVVLTGTGERPWLGFTADGRAVMGTAAEYSKYSGTLVQAVGGSHILLRNDLPSNLGVGAEFGDTRHPRTAVGTKPDGSVVLMVVDGRQSFVSNGASLADLAEIFGSLGCSDAINLDGGGSSTFVLAENNGFVTKNSPSAGALRAVANGLLVVKQ